MSIKFPDFQVLVSRSDQIPRVNREGDQTGAAGKMAPQVSQEFDHRQQRVEHNKAQDKVRERQEHEGRGRQGQQQQEEQDSKKQGGRRRIDLKA